TWQRRFNDPRKAGNVRFPRRTFGLKAQPLAPSPRPCHVGRDGPPSLAAVAYSSGAKLCRNMRLAGAGVASDDLQFADLPAVLRSGAGAAQRALVRLAPEEDQP